MLISQQLLHLRLNTKASTKERERGLVMELFITQLTDIHIKEEADLDVLLGRTESIVGAILEIINDAKNTLLLICVTGDITYSSTGEQYAIADLFLDDIYNRIRIRHSELYIQFVFIPGNHDCDFTSPLNNVRSTLLKSPALDMDDPDSMELCIGIQSEYLKFIKKWSENNLAAINKDNCIFTEYTIKNQILGNYNIRIHCINTAWDSLLKEVKNKKLKLPDGIEYKKDNDIIITLMHHGEEWLGYEGNQNWNEYYKQYSDIILVGHDHYSDFVQKTNYDSMSNYFIKGNQLYDHDNQSQSGFNILKVNLNEGIQFFYTYSWNGKLFERIIDTKALKFVKNKFSNSRIELNKELKKFLEDIEIDITNKFKSPLLLSDIYAFPTIRGEKISNSKEEKLSELKEDIRSKSKEDKNSKSKEVCSYRGQDSILRFINAKKYVMINGNKEYGKTALLKRLFMIFYESKCFPIYLEPKEIVSVDNESLNALIRETYKNTYLNLNIDDVMQMEKEKRICFIDNFHELVITDKSIKKVLQYLKDKFSIVILSNNTKNDLLVSVKNLETNDYLKDEFAEAEITELRRYGRNRIIDRWLLLEDPEENIKSLKFDNKKKEKLEQIQGVMKNGYFNRTPIEFLLVLSYLGNTEKMNADYSRYSYIYDCLIKEKINDIANKNTKEATMYLTLLEQLAYSMYSNESQTYFNEDFISLVIANYNENYPKIKMRKLMVIQRLVQYKILEEKRDKFRFKYNYMYYYFIGSYINDQMSPEDKDAKMVEILSDLSIEINYNIALFLAYSLNTEYAILPKLTSISEALLETFKDFKYEDQYDLLAKLDNNIEERLNTIYVIPDNEDIPDLQNKKQIENDDFDEKYEVEIKKNREESIEIVNTEFVKLLRLIEFQGDVLKNYSTKIKNGPRREMIRLMGKSNLKLVGFLCNQVSLEVDRIIKLINEKSKEADKEHSPEKEQILMAIKEFTRSIWSSFIEVNVDNLAICWECDSINEDIEMYREEMKSAFFDMVDIEYKFRISTGKLPIKEIQHCLTGKRKLGSFSLMIMTNIIASYLTSNQYDIKDKTIVCQMMGYDVKKMFLSDQKNIILEDA